MIKKLCDKYNLYCVMNRTGHKAKFVAEQFGAVYSTTDIDNVLSDENVDMVLITTRHDSHAEYVIKSLNAGKHVFVEKPLAVNSQQLDEIAGLLRKIEGERLLHTGFNRRFSPYIDEIKKHVDTRINPLFINYRMNAGYVPLDSWIHESGGRIIGELCHIIDLVLYLTNSTVESMFSESITPVTGKFSDKDNKTVTLKFSDGSLANITYFAVGNKSFPKEYMEVHYDENTLVMDNYQKLTGYGIKVKKIKTKIPSKGMLEQYLELFQAINTNPLYFPIPIEDQINVTDLTFQI